MASLFDNLNSSDSEEDADYVPNESSDEEEPLLQIIDEELETKKEQKVEMGKNEKDKANVIYESFLKEVESEGNSPVCARGESSSLVSSSSTSAVQASGISSAGPSSGISSTSSSLGISSTSSSLKSSSCSSLSMLLSDANSEKISSPEIAPEKPAEEVEFAGETIALTEDGTILSSNFAATKNVQAKTTCPLPVKRKGLESVLGSIQNKKIKVTTLQKSLLDWNTFKKQEGISEELERFNKGKGGFIERKRFLERSDVRSYETERDMRMSRLKKS